MCNPQVALHKMHQVIFYSIDTHLRQNPAMTRLLLGLQVNHRPIRVDLYHLHRATHAPWEAY